MDWPELHPQCLQHVRLRFQVSDSALNYLQLRVERFAVLFVVVGALDDEFAYEFGMVAKEVSGPSIRPSISFETAHSISVST